MRHDVNEAARSGKDNCRDFPVRMARCRDETLADMAAMVDAGGLRDRIRQVA
jgi:hypothetical protein